MDPKVGIKTIGDRTGDGDFYFKGTFFIKISTNPESMNPRLLCDLYEPWTYIFHPLTSMEMLAHPEGSGSHMKCLF